MKKKGLFTGWKDVFSFTAAQNIKGGGYKASTIILGIVIAIAFSLISILMAVFQSDDTDNDAIVNIEDGFEEGISEIFLVDSEVLDDEVLKNLITLSLSLEGVVDEKLNVTLIDESQKNESIKGNDKAIIVEVAKQDEKQIIFNAYASEGSALADGVAEDYMDYVLTYINVYGYQIAGVAPEDMLYFMAPYYTQSASVEESVENVGVMLTEMLVPMLFSLLMYAMILLHGQSVTKSVVAEKSSKLMEMILTSVKPYALISGKVLAVATMAMTQLFFWIICGVGGYMVGGVIAESINPDYTNYVSLVINAMTVENGDGAFTVGAVVISLIFLVVGFLMYCVLAGLVAATVSKMEDISTAMSLFQVPVIIGWLAAYFISFMDNDKLLTAVHLVPVTSPFILPADIILGKCSIVEGVVSLVILSATTFGLILITGKVYKGKIFNRS